MTFSNQQQKVTDWISIQKFYSVLSRAVASLKYTKGHQFGRLEGIWAVRYMQWWIQLPGEQEYISHNFPPSYVSLMFLAFLHFKLNSAPTFGGRMFVTLTHQHTPNGISWNCTWTSVPPMPKSSLLEQVEEVNPKRAWHKKCPCQLSVENDLYRQIFSFSHNSMWRQHTARTCETRIRPTH